MVAARKRGSTGDACVDRESVCGVVAVWVGRDNIWGVVGVWVARESVRGVVEV